MILLNLQMLLWAENAELLGHCYPLCVSDLAIIKQNLCVKLSSAIS